MKSSFCGYEVILYAHTMSMHTECYVYASKTSKTRKWEQENNEVEVEGEVNECTL